jgi:DNA-binding NtrC family response regulator
MKSNMEDKLASKQLNILIVDDDIECLDGYKIVLESCNYEYTTENNPNRALGLYKNTFNTDNYKFDVVITDMRMPLMSGIELLKQIKKLDKTARVIIITAFFNSETEKAINYYEPYAFLGKPFKLLDLILILNKIELEKKGVEKVQNKIDLVS